MDIVAETGNRYHILMMIADGQVTPGKKGGFSEQEKETVEAVVAARQGSVS